MVKVLQLQSLRKAVIISEFGLHMLEKRVWNLCYLENSAEELYLLLQQALQLCLLEAATSIALELLRHKDVTVAQHRFILAHLGSMNSLRIVQEAQRLLESNTK